MDLTTQGDLIPDPARLSIVRRLRQITIDAILSIRIHALRRLELVTRIDNFPFRLSCFAVAVTGPTICQIPSPSSLGDAACILI